MAWDAPVKAPNDPLLSADWNAMVVDQKARVPYVGASAHVNLGVWNLTSGGTVQGEQITSTDDMTMAGYFLNVPAAADINYFELDGSVNPYTGVADFAPFNITATVNTAPSNVPVNFFGLQTALTQNKVFTGAETFYIQSTAGIWNIVNVNPAHDGLATVHFETSDGILSSITTAVRTVTSRATASQVFDFTGVRNTVTDKTTYNNGAGTLNLNVSGMKNTVSTSGTGLTAGTLNVNTYGEFIDVTGGGAGTSKAYGIWINKVSGAGANYGIWDGTAGAWVMDNDNKKLIFGQSQDAAIEWTTAGDDHLRLDPQHLAAGHYIILNVPKTTTGDPANPIEGMIYWNTFDNLLRMYCDGAWRTLAAW